MGLDMYVRRVSKPHLDERKVYYPDELYQYSVIKKEDFSEEMYGDLLPYMQPIRFASRSYDTDRIAIEFGITKPRPYGYSNGYILFDDGNDLSENRKRIEISSRDIDEKYTVWSMDSGYAFSTEEVAYWRKAYDVQEFMHSRIRRDVLNCGYYLLNEEIIGDYDLTFRLPFEDDGYAVNIPHEPPSEETALFYHEWY